MKMGIVGCGVTTDEFMKNVSLLNGITITTVYSKTFEETKKFCEKHKIRKPAETFQELLSSDIDAVYVASQNGEHFKYSIEAIEKNKHVLCEKPAAISEAQLEFLEDKAKEKEVFFMEAMRTLYFPSYLKLKELLRENYLGKIISIEGSLGKVTSKAGYEPDPSEGALLDLGIYLIYAIIDILGVPKSIKASALKFKNGVDSTITAILQYKDSIATFYASCIAQTKMELRILCEKGTITIAPSSASDRVIIQLADGKVEEILCSRISTGMIYEIEAFLSKTKDDNLHRNVMKVVDKIRKRVYLNYGQDSISSVSDS